MVEASVHPPRAISAKKRAKPKQAATPGGVSDPRLRLWRRKDPAVDAALAAALPTAGDDERVELVAVMLERRDSAGWVAVLASQDRAGPKEREMVVAAARHGLDGAIRTLAGRGPGSGTREAFRLIRDAKLGRLAYLLTESIRRDRGESSEQAADILVELCGTPGIEGVDELREAVDEAVAGFDRHRHAAVLEAYLRLMPAAMPRSREALNTPDHPAVQALASRLAQAARPTDRRALLPLASAEPLHPAIRLGLKRCGTPLAWSEALAQGHLLLEPCVADLLQGLDDPQTFAIQASDAEAMDPEARRWLPRLWASLPLDPGTLIERLVGLAELQDVPTRTAAIRVLGEITPHASHVEAWINALIRYGHDPDEHVARLAAATLERGLRRLGGPDEASSPPAPAWSTLARLASSPHPSVRAQVGQRVGRPAFERMWSASDRLEPARRLASIQALRKLDPGFDRRLAKRVRHGSANPAPTTNLSKETTAPPHELRQRLRALAWVSCLRCPPGELTEATLQAAGCDDTKVVATAALALGLCQDPRSQAVLQSLTDHDNARVRANAIEALHQRATQAARQDHHATKPNAFETLSPDRLAELSRDDAPRVRANALLLRFGLEGRPALVALAEMLRDPRPEHRRSAVWLAGVTGVIDAIQAADAANHATATTATRQDGPDPTAAIEVLDTLPAEAAEPTPPSVEDLLLGILDRDQARGAAA